MAKSNTGVCHGRINTFTRYTTFTRVSFARNTMAHLAGIACYTKIGVPFKRPNDYTKKSMETKIKINCVIGIDPGANGGLSVFIPGRNVKVVKMPKDVTELRDFFAYYAENYRPIVFLEKLSVRPDDVTAEGGKANLGKLYRIQKLMANYEHLKATIETTGIPFVMVHPMRWQTDLKLRERGKHEEKADRKRRYKETAAQLYLGVDVTLWNADALLIMHFGRWALVNDANWVKSNLPKPAYEKLF